MKIMRYNPMYHFINYFGDAVYRGAIGIDERLKDIGQFDPRWATLGYLYAFGVISIFIGHLLYIPIEDKVAMRL